ncbi:MAG: fused MFS/spermidine synthase [Acidobacteriota bacterium]
MLEVIVFLCGAVVMILELVGSRILAPYMGTSIVVWTSLIGIILGCLSIGYWWGGKLSDEKPSYRVLSAIILLAGFFIAGIAVSKSFVLALLQSSGGNIHIVSTVATILLFAPPSILLGMVSPYAVKLKMNDLQRSGSTVGSLYAISTMGSIVGTFLAGFFLIAFFGSTNILIIMSVVLAVASFLAYSGDRRVKAASLSIFVMLFVGANLYDNYLAGLGVHDIDTDYNRVLVYRSTDGATARPIEVMVTNPHGKQSSMFIDDPIELATPYTKFYKMAPHFKPGVKKVLMLGGGGYSFPKYAMHHYPEMTMDVVEIDPGMTELARRFFALEDNPRLKVIHEDARTFLNKTGERYDVVLGDTFNAHYSIPFHVSTVETVRRLYDVLADDGVVLANTIAAIEGDEGRFLRAEYATFKAVFPQVYLFPVSNPYNGSRWQNVMIVALKSTDTPAFRSQDPAIDELLCNRWTKPVPLDLPILTDDYAPVDRYVTSLR